MTRALQRWFGLSLLTLWFVRLVEEVLAARLLPDGLFNLLGGLSLFGLCGVTFLDRDLALSIYRSPPASRRPSDRTILFLIRPFLALFAILGAGASAVAMRHLLGIPPR
jgi:hypothetical protein